MSSDEGEDKIKTLIDVRATKIIEINEDQRGHKDQVREQLLLVFRDVSVEKELQREKAMQ